MPLTVPFSCALNTPVISNKMIKIGRLNENLSFILLDKISVLGYCAIDAIKRLGNDYFKIKITLAKLEEDSGSFKRIINKY